MKRNIKFFTIVIALLLLSTIILTGCMYAIAADNGEMKPYNLNRQKEISDSSVGNIVEETPPAQTELQKKFDAYLHKDGNAITVFSDEQYAELAAMRENGERTALTYDEALYIINDSIDLYFSYDVVELTNAIKDGITLKFQLSTVGEQIHCYHGDFSEYDDYYMALDKYESMIEDIFSIIYYRIYMHDAGFTRITEAYHDGELVCFADNSHMNEVSSIVPTKVMDIASLNGGKSSGNEYKNYIVSEYKNIMKLNEEFYKNSITDSFEVEELKAPLLLMYQKNNSDIPPFTKFYLIEECSKGIDETISESQVFPTKELESLCPQRPAENTSSKEDMFKQLLEKAESGAVLVGKNSKEIRLDDVVASDLYDNVDKFVETTEGRLYDGLIEAYVVYSDGTVFGMIPYPVDNVPEKYSSCEGLIYGVIYKVALIDGEIAVEETKYGYLPSAALKLPLNKIGY